jgi:hypothetical protein
MIGFQVKIEIDGQTVTGEDEALLALQSVWSCFYPIDLMECWADGTWIVELPVAEVDEATIEQIEITTTRRMKASDTPVSIHIVATRD